MWYVDPLLDNNREIAAIQQPLLGNDFVNSGRCYIMAARDS
jgi:hypothetical protein